MRHLINCVIFLCVPVVIASSVSHGQQKISTAERALTKKETLGKKLFFDKNLSTPVGQACADCHPSEPGDDGTPPLFTDFTYDNLGVPQNPENPFYYLPEELNPDGIYFIDLGLGGELNKPSENGKFKVPSLRNIAKTAPYLHNGIFKNLRQVVFFTIPGTSGRGRLLKFAQMSIVRNSATSVLPNRKSTISLLSCKLSPTATIQVRNRVGDRK